MKRRYAFFYVLLAVACIMITTRLIKLQITNGAFYREKSDVRSTRSVELIAPRGEIYDRYGRKIVVNRTGYSVYIQEKQDRSAEELNLLIKNLACAIPSVKQEKLQSFPIELVEGKFAFYINKKEIKKWKNENGFSEKDSAEKIVKLLCKYNEDQKQYSKEEMLLISAVRLDMKSKGFSQSSPYLICDDAPIESISLIKEQSGKFPSVSIITQPIREYPYGSLGAHMLGHVGGISREEYEKHKNEGYSINSHIGKDGIEKYMEEFLRGENGRASIEQTKGGYSIGQKIEKEPVRGRDITLTIDLDMQLAAEKALHETIQEIRQQATDESSGSDADSGSIVIVDVNTGDILAMASYPTYDIGNFGREYNDLLENPTKPLFNRALSGTYSPASTFKILVGAAALEEKIITPEDTILDTGRYTYFKDYQPACWIYNQTGGTHGYVNVSQAIKESCNIFFYEVGRNLTIEKINSYARKFGFGQKSGIELSAEEQKGVVASPENREKKGGIWYPGDVCQTAIGQSDTLVTPIQLANYIATIANGGTRYRPHLIKSVQEQGKTTESEIKPEVLSKVELKKKNYEAITQGIRSVVTDGTAQSAFAGCNVKVAAKTGSAQTSTKYTNGICVAYAPYDEPRIAIACVIEKAGSGARSAIAVRKIVDSYFNSADEETEAINTLTK